MQVNVIGTAQLADVLEQARVLDTLAVGAAELGVVEFNGQDVLAFTCSVTGETAVIYGPEAFDIESGGSVHDHGRATIDDASPVEA